MGTEWLGAPAAASLLGIQLKTLYGLINSGHPARVQIGRVIRLRRTDVMDYVERCRIKPGTLGHLYPPGDKGLAAASICRHRGDLDGDGRTVEEAVVH